MAAIGCSTATTQIGQLCATRHNIRIAGFQAVTQQAVNSRSQSCSVAEMGSRAAMTGEGRHRAYQCNSAWGRGNNTIISGRRVPSLGSQSRGNWWGNFLQIFRPSATASNNFGTNFGENVLEDSRATEPEVLEAEVEPAAAKAPEDPTLNLAEMRKADVTEKALDQGSSVANSALEKVGDVLRSTGLEINLDVGLKELTIKDLVLRDLGLVVEVKTTPPSQSQTQTMTQTQTNANANANTNTNGKQSLLDMNL